LRDNFKLDTKDVKMASEVEALKVAFATNTNWVEWAAFAVFVGLLGDIAVILIFDFFDKDKSWWEIILGGVASAIIAAGVWGEPHFGHRATDASGQLQAILEKQAARRKRGCLARDPRCGESKRASGISKRTCRENYRLGITQNVHRVRAEGNGAKTETFPPWRNDRDSIFPTRPESRFLCAPRNGNIVGHSLRMGGAHE
jgi:hypothetical protein